VCDASLHDLRFSRRETLIVLSLRCGRIKSGKNVSTLQRTVLPPCSGSKCPYCHWFDQSPYPLLYFLTSANCTRCALDIDPEDVRNVLLRNSCSRFFIELIIAVWIYIYIDLLVKTGKQPAQVNGKLDLLELIRSQRDMIRIRKQNTTRLFVASNVTYIYRTFRKLLLNGNCVTL
jgi:hypothetical protein